MSAEREKIIDKAKKLRELANRGIDGEKETAKRMYAEYKEKHKLTDEEVDGHEYTKEFTEEFGRMTDEEIIANIAESLIALGVTLIFSLITSLERKYENKQRDNYNYKMDNLNKNNKRNRSKKKRKKGYTDTEIKSYINIIDETDNKDVI